MSGRKRFGAIGLWSAFAISGCAQVPNLPDETQLPMQEVVEHAVCELRDALKSDFIRRYPEFKPDEWSVAISLNPQIDTDFNVNAGTGFKTNDSPPVTHYLSWVLGPGTGLMYDIKAHNEGTTGYVLSTAKLLRSKASGDCATMRHDFNLSHNIGIRKWLEESMPSGPISANTIGLNKLTFNTWVEFKFNGNGAGVTWTVPRGSAYGSLGGSYQAQYILGIQFSPEAPPPAVPIEVTLPDDGHEPRQTLLMLRKQADKTPPRPHPGGVAGVSAESQQRLDLLQLEQAIKNLRISQ